ncbi:putative reverse transcriptase domain-containing protein [Tanacetum coccineum]
MLHGTDQQMEKKEDGGLYFMDQIWVSLVGDTRTVIMSEAHSTRYSIHPRADKMYYDLRDIYWWLGIRNGTCRVNHLGYLQVPFEQIAYHISSSNHNSKTGSEVDAEKTGSVVEGKVNEDTHGDGMGNVCDGFCEVIMK